MPRSIVHFSCALALVTLFAACEAAERASKSSRTSAAQGEWPQWRGPDRNGISPERGLLDNWKAKKPRLVWTAKGLGSGFASISIADGRIFTMGDRDDEQFVIALDLKGGKEQWRTPIGKGWDKGGYAGPRCTPTVDGDRLYAVGTHGDLVCLDVATGKEHWSKNFKSDFGGKMMSGWGYSESPLIDGDKIICTPGAQDAMMVALDKNTGSELWRCKVGELGPSGKDGAAYSSVVISEAEGVRHYVQLVGRGMIGVRADDGKLLWNYNRVANGVANIPTAIVKDNHVFCSTGYQTGAALLKLSKGDDGLKAEEVYFLPSDKFQNHHGGMILVGDYIYAGHGHNKGFPICLELKTGNIQWGPERGPGTDSAAVAYADGDLYFRYQNGTVALIEATPDQYKLKGSFDIPDVTNPSWPHLVIAGGKLYVREQDALLCYDIKK